MMYAHSISVSFSMARASASAWSSGSAQFCALNATASELSNEKSEYPLSIEEENWTAVLGQRQWSSMRQMSG
jgi:hypothetical protein